MPLKMALITECSENTHQLISDEGYSDVTFINATTCHVTVSFIYLYVILLSTSQTVKIKVNYDQLRQKLGRNGEGSSVVYAEVLSLGLPE